MKVLRTSYVYKIPVLKSQEKERDGGGGGEKGLTEAKDRIYCEREETDLQGFALGV